MKKTSILIAMFAVIALAPVVRAELAINFDGGRTTSDTSFMEAVKAVEINQDIKPSAEKYAWPALYSQDFNSNCAAASMCGGAQYLADVCTCKPLPGYEDFYNNINSVGWWAHAMADGSLTQAGANPARKVAAPGSRDNAAVRGLAGYSPLQKRLRDLILSQFNVHDAFSSSIFQALHDEKTIIVYNDKGVYLASGSTLYGTNDKKLLGKVKTAIGGQTKMGFADVGLAVVLGCAFSDDCREDVVNYVNNLHDDEHDTYHNNHDGSNSDYEVNKKVK